MPDHRPLDEKIDELRRLQEAMLQRVTGQFEEAALALLERDTERAEKVRQSDDEIDALELRIDNLCERILALHTPVAVDLRLILTAVKINTDLERIGDHAKNLAKSTAPLADWEAFLEQADLRDLARTVRDILTGACEAFLEEDPDRARAVIERDEEANQLYNNIFDTTARLSREHPEGSEALIYLVTAAKALERIGDHAKNIAESTVFLEEGKDIRHGGLDEEAAGFSGDLDGDAIPPSQLAGK
ncbi:MAG: phosphate transport system regulatory protein PhoU [Bacteroidetes bacterium SW_4_67_19]|nr:MAG: phosphate transport system regulatory protein PhoU [Bacteroidetes bacterium SW_4_67_19]